MSGSAMARAIRKLAKAHGYDGLLDTPPRRARFLALYLEDDSVPVARRQRLHDALVKVAEYLTRPEVQKILAPALSREARNAAEKVLANADPEAPISIQAHRVVAADRRARAQAAAQAGADLDARVVVQVAREQLVGELNRQPMDHEVADRAKRLAGLP